MPLEPDPPFAPLHAEVDRPHAVSYHAFDRETARCEVVSTIAWRGGLHDRDA